MRTINYTITEKDFDVMNVMTDRERNRYLEDEVLGMNILCGYGFYGCRGLKNEDNKFFAVIEIGNTCD